MAIPHQRLVGGGLNFPQYLQPRPCLPAASPLVPHIPPPLSHLYTLVFPLLWLKMKEQPLLLTVSVYVDLVSLEHWAHT